MRPALQRMGTREANLLLTALGLAVLTQGARAQPLGMPSAQHPAHWATVSACAWRQSFTSPEGIFLLQGPSLKLSLAPAPWLDLSVHAGATDWIFEDAAGGKSWWSKGYEPVAGVGVWLEPRLSRSLPLFAAVSLTTSQNEGAFYLRGPLDGERRITQWDEVKQLFLVGSGALGFGLDPGPLKTFAGVAVRKASRRWEEHPRERTTSGWQTQPAVRRNERWREQYGPFLAIEWHLPGRFFLSLEGAHWGNEDYHLAVGLGQIGPP